MKRIYLMLSAAVLLAACAAPTRVTSIPLPSCDILVPTPSCTNSAGTGPAAPAVTYNTNSGSVAPRNVCANRSSTLTINLKPVSSPGNPRKLGSVAVVPKDISDTWLIGSNNVDVNKIEIPIPSYLPPNTYYGYTLVNSGVTPVQCVDPRVHVDPS